MLFPARLGVFLLALTCPVCLIADGVFTTNTCTLTDVPLSGPPIVYSQTDPNSCFVTSLDPNFMQGGQARASSSVTLHLPISGQASAPVGASISTLAASYPSYRLGPVGESGSAQTSVTIDYLFTTAGPARPGFIQLNQSSVSAAFFTPGPDRPSEMRASISVGPLSQNCPGSYLYATCDGSLADPMTRFLPTTTLPFTLGQNFAFHEDAALRVDSFRDILENGSVGTNFTFTLFEADGVTPVQVLLATPEPGSAMLWAGGLLGLVTLIPRSLHRGE